MALGVVGLGGRWRGPGQPQVISPATPPTNSLQVSPEVSAAPGNPGRRGPQSSHSPTLLAFQVEVIERESHQCLGEAPPLKVNTVQKLTYLPPTNPASAAALRGGVVPREEALWVPVLPMFTQLEESHLCLAGRDQKNSHLI